MSRVFWDTNLFIYLLEDYGELSTRVYGLRLRMIERNDRLFTSAMTLGEILVRPLAAGNGALALKYEEMILQGAGVLAFDGADAARRYAKIRQDRAIKPPDAIQLACAAAAGVDLFITNDDRLSRKIVPGIQFVSSLDRAFV